MSILSRFALDEKVAIVTGASSGLGVAFARALAEAGCHVGLGGRRAERLADTAKFVEETGRRALAIATDVTRPEHCQRLVDETVREFGRLDILVNNAGVASAVPATREPPEAFRSVLETNLMGAYWMAQCAARVMPPGSSIINIGSVVGTMTVGLPQAAYTASKAALEGLTRDLAQQWSGRKGIRVNTLAPGFFLTDMAGEYRPGYLDAVIEHRVPMGRLGVLEECAAAVVFLASDAASYITGSTLTVDGGLLA